MASITQCKNGKVRVQIKKNNTSHYKSFHNLETAQLFAKYKEELLDDMSAFEVKPTEMLTFIDMIELKIKNLKDVGRSEINDYEGLKRDFSEFLDRFVIEIKLPEFSQKFQILIDQKITVGGDRYNQNENTGRKVIPSPATILRKFRCLAACYSYAISEGYEIENNPQKVISTITNLLKKDKNND